MSYKESHECLKEIGSQFENMQRDLYEEYQRKLESAFNRKFNVSKPLTPDFVMEVKARINGGNQVKGRGSRKSATLEGKIMEIEGDNRIGMKTRGRKVGTIGSQIIDEEMDIRQPRKNIPNSILKQCLDEAIQKEGVETRAFPNRFSMILFQTKKKVYKFKLADISQVCFLASPIQELTFEKRMKELMGELPEHGDFEVEDGGEKGRLVVESSSGMYNSKQILEKKMTTRTMKRRIKKFWMMIRTKKALIEEQERLRLCSGKDQLF